jgi:hypothetical protein
MSVTSFGFENGSLLISFNKCAFKAEGIADAVEAAQCGAVPNGDSSINCGTKTYQVIVS